MSAYRCVILLAVVGLLCLLPGHLTAQQAKSPDFSGNGAVDFYDFFIFADAFGKQGTGANAKFDLNSDGQVNSSDFFIFALNFGKLASAVSLTPPTSPGPNTGAKFTAALDKTSGVKAGDKVTLTVSATGVSGLTGFVAEALYDSTALGDNFLATGKLTGAVVVPRILETITGVTGFNRRTETAGSKLPPTAGVSGNTDLVAFEFTTKTGFTATSIGIRRLILVAGSKLDTIPVSPSPLVLSVNQPSSPPTTGGTVPDPAKQDSTKLGVWLDLNTASDNQMVASGSVAPGAEVTIQVFGRNLTSSTSFGVTLGYDPAVLTPVISKFKVGDYLGSSAISLTPQVSTSGGVTQVTFGAALLGGSPRSGNGFLGTAVFQVSDKFTDGYTEIKVNRLTLGTAAAAIQTSNAILRALKNAPPVAKFTIRPDAIKAGDTKSLVTLDALGSSDPDGDPITIKWTASAGITFKKGTSDSSRVAQAQISGEVTSNVEITLTVTDKNGAKTTATQTLKVIAPPSATAAVAVDLDAAADNQNVGLLYGAKAGDTFTLQVFVRDVTGVTGYTVKVTYDSTRVGSPTYANGSLVAGTFIPLTQSGAGFLQGGGSLLGGSPASGSGLLATFTFKAKDGFEGGTTLSATSVNLRMGATSKELVTGSIDAQITADVPVKAAPAASFDEDGDVDFDDFFALALNFNTAKGDPGFDSRFDLDGDGDVDFEDFFAFAVMFGLIEE